VRFSNRELAPFWGAGTRFLVAGLLLAGLMVVLGLPLPRGRALRGAVLYGLLNFGAAFALTYHGLLHLHAGFGQILLALVPLLTLLLAVLQRQERFRPAALAGALLSLGGIAVMSQAPVGGAVPLGPLLALLGSALCFAEAAVLVRGFPSIHPVTLNALGMLTGAAVLLLASFVLGEAHSLPSRPETWAAMAYLVVAGSILVFVLYVVVLQRWTASRAAYVFVLIPMVTLALSAWLDQEPLGLPLLLGGALVLGGVYAGALRPSGRARQAPGPAPGGAG
jgi:drug/metabolite transporter (DMT)-like permease